MFAGLLLASFSAAVAHTALFQRKARSGWLDELDEIRSTALDRPDGEIDEAVEGDDIWTDLREGGVYDDPHEISSLYADDTRPSRIAGNGAGRSSRGRSVADAPPTVDDEPPAEPVVQEPVAAEIDADIWTQTELLGDAVGPPGASYESDQMWAQPAPHPIRPSEMWHPAELEPMGGGFEASAPAADVDADRLGAQLAAELVIDHDEPLHDDLERQAPQPVARRLESELLAAADVAVLEQGPNDQQWTEPIATPPVGRRNRRDRPTLPGTTSDRYDEASLPGRGERSPLPEAPLPPAAEPVAAVPEQVVEPVADLAAAPVAEAVVAPESPPASEPATEPAVPVVAETPREQEAAIGHDGLVAVPDTILRIGGARRAAATAGWDRATVALDEGWCWVAPGEGTPSRVVVDLASVELTVEPGATILAVVDADRSCFIAVADGVGQLRRGEQVGPLGRGAIVMVDPAGVAQIDFATDEEIAADPVVAENLALDADL